VISLYFLLSYSFSLFFEAGLLKMNETSTPRTDSYFSLTNMKKCNIFFNRKSQNICFNLGVSKKAANQAEGQKVTD
jgi:hypothetical protein